MGLENPHLEGKEGVDRSDLEDNREEVIERKNEMYTDQDNWQMVNVTAVDLLAAFGCFDEDEAFGINEDVRIDIDGVSTLSDTLDYGLNTTLSIRLSEKMARALISELQGVLGPTDGANDYDDVSTIHNGEFVMLRYEGDAIEGFTVGYGPTHSEALKDLLTRVGNLVTLQEAARIDPGSEFELMDGLKI